MSKKNKVITLLLSLSLVLGVIQLAPKAYQHIESAIKPTQVLAKEKPTLKYRKATVINKNEYSPSFDMLKIVQENLNIEETSDYYINVLVSNNTINTFRVSHEEYLNAQADDEVFVLYNKDGDPKYMENFEDIRDVSFSLSRFLPFNETPLLEEI